MNRRLLATIVSIILLCLVTSSCSNKKETSNTEPTERTEQTMATEATMESFIELPLPGEPEWTDSQKTTEAGEKTAEYQTVPAETETVPIKDTVPTETQKQPETEEGIQRGSDVGTAGEVDWG